MTDQRKSPNFNARRGADKPSMIILHYTGMETAKAALEKMCDPESEVSAHYMIDEDGSILQLVEDEHRAWHAGVAHWAGETDINSHSIGIEIVNPGHEFGYPGSESDHLGNEFSYSGNGIVNPGHEFSYQPFPERQIEQVSALCKIKIEEWGISPACILGHSDVAPGRKADPGELFPWQRLAEEGIGIWPQPQEMDYQAAADLVTNHDALHDLLAGVGYAPLAEFEEVLTAFHRRYYPEKFKDGADPARPCTESTARLLALVRAHHEFKT